MRFTTILAGLLLSCLASTQANAEVIHEVVNGKLTGAQNVEVDGELYNVEFVKGTCSEIFSDCTEGKEFIFNTKPKAHKAAMALINQVFVGEYDAERIIDACPKEYHPNNCNMWLPYAIRMVERRGETTPKIETLRISIYPKDYRYDDSVNHYSVREHADYPSVHVRFYKPTSALPWVVLSAATGLVGFSLYRRGKKS